MKHSVTHIDVVTIVIVYLVVNCCNHILEASQLHLQSQHSVIELPLQFIKMA